VDSLKIEWVLEPKGSLEVVQSIVRLARAAGAGDSGVGSSDASGEFCVCGDVVRNLL